jgi:hypothetical protein
MAIPGELTKLVGEWGGIKQLWLSPEEPARTSDSQAEISIIANGNFVELDYS